MKKDTPSGSGAEASARDGSAEPTFEAAMKRLAEIVAQLENGELPLDEALRLFEEGVVLSKRAGALLDHAQAKVEALTRAADGRLGTVPLEVDADEPE